ncbi:MAG: DNA polymerase III subunit alpha [Nitrospiraceae bacterium]|nr:DNA polymerase III subunit alpha [Nitrospiraceae bacterium]
MSAGFAHLHVHSDYSVLDGACKIASIIERCREYNMWSCAVTDHGVLFAAVPFYQAARKAGIKPIIGCELYVAKGSRFDKSARSQSEAYCHLLLLCENEEGYHNLCRLSSIGYLEGHHYKPRVDEEVLRKYSAGLIASSACLGGEIPQCLLRDDVAAAEVAAAKYVDIYGQQNFLIELMDHGMPEERRVNPKLVELAERRGLMLIATNDCHYIDKADSEAHEALLCIQTASTLNDENRFRFPTNEFHFTSPEEMRERFKEWPEAVSNTEKVAERCNLEIPLGKHLVPSFNPPEEFTKEAYLRNLVDIGLANRYDSQPTQEHIDRVNFELDVIERMGFVDYFLVVWDLVAHARNMGIPVGPGRGSGAGSLVAYALEITNIDPLKYGLLFERFLNPDRVSMPDFDLDFCYRRREELIEWVRKQYGEENVSQIITFGRMLAKNVIRNVGRVMGMPYGDVDEIAKLVPDELKITLKSAIEKEPQLKARVESDPEVRRLWNLALRLEGTIGNLGTHAAGVVICDEPLTNHVALFKAASSDIVATQVEMKGVEEVGLLKMDFLGLRTLTVVHDAVRFVKENRGVSIDIDHIDTHNAKAYALLRSGKTSGVFQLESSGMRDLAKRIGLESLEEICALVALFRPGPMKFLDQYVESKHDPKKIVYDHPLLEPILKETYGVALYQEQVMQNVRAVAGFSLGQADILRRAMGKKKIDLMAELRDKFIAGAAANAIDPKTAELLFSKIEQFAGYGFNKSHSMAYAFVAYQTAFLKANYPAEFMAALLSSEAGNLDKVGVYVEECRRMGVDVIPPDINKSCSGFTVEGDSIRFGMGAIKNVGEGAVEALVEEREANGPFADIFDLCARVESRQVNRRLLESLNKAGAFSSTGWNRRQVEQVLDAAISEGQIAQRERESGQTSLFDLEGAGNAADAMHHKPNVDEWPENEILAFEKEMLGLYVSSHPLARHAAILDRYVTAVVDDIAKMREDQEVVVGGLLSQVKHYTTSRGSKMAFVTLDTPAGPCEITVFSDVFERKAGLIVPDMVVLVPSRVNYRNGEAGLVAIDIVPIEEAESRLTKCIHIALKTVGLDEPLVERLAQTLANTPGRCSVYLHCITPEHTEVVVEATEVCLVAATPALREEVESLLGEGSIWFSGKSGVNGAR